MNLASLVIREDKANHAIDGAVVYAVAAGVGRALGVPMHREVALGVALLAGCAKEGYDAWSNWRLTGDWRLGRHTVEPWDVGATFLGALTVYAAGELS